MGRRSTPGRIDEARRAATRKRLISEGVTETTADAWIAAWEAQAARDGERGAAPRTGRRAGTGSPLSGTGGFDLRAAHSPRGGQGSGAASGRRPVYRPPGFGEERLRSLELLRSDERGRPSALPFDEDPPTSRSDPDVEVVIEGPRPHACLRPGGRSLTHQQEPAVAQDQRASDRGCDAMDPFRGFEDRRERSPGVLRDVLPSRPPGRRLRHVFSRSGLARAPAVVSVLARTRPICAGRDSGERRMPGWECHGVGARLHVAGIVMPSVPQS